MRYKGECDGRTTKCDVKGYIEPARFRNIRDGMLLHVGTIDEGIWEYGEYSDFEEEIMNMWALETDILTCNCYLGCIAEQDSIPQDMEIQEVNISEFVDFLENVVGEKIDYDYKYIFNFWAEKMCY